MVPDYYAMLGVEPAADRAAIEAALARAQPAWSSGTRNPKTKHTFQSYLDQIPALRQALLADPSARAAYDAELFAGRRAERDRTLDVLQRLVRLRAAKGGLTGSDRSVLRSEATRLGLAADDLDRLVAPFPTLADRAPEIEQPDPPADAIDAATRRQINLTLEHLRKRDLYDVLESARDAPAAELVARADAERKRWMQKSQVTAEKTAWLEAISYAQSHLSAPEARARYDRTLNLEAEEALTGTFGFALDGLGRLDPGTRRALLDEAAALGIGPDRAGRLLDRACRAAGVAMGGEPADPSANGPPPRLFRCRSCGGVTEFAHAAKSAGGAACRHCRATLQWDCPVCKRSRWVDEPRCACGFPLALRDPLLKHLEAAQHAHKVRDYDAAVAHLRRVLEFAPRHTGARRGIERIKERLAEIDRTRGSFEAERARRHLLAARQAVEAWARLIDPTAPEVRAARSDLAREIQAAATLAAQARDRAATDPAGARDLYRRALALAADLPEARAGLAGCPPDPPADLRLECETGGVRLRWTAPAPDGLGPVAARVLRKRGGMPTNAADGADLAETGAAEYLDADVAPGDTVGYAVFSRRGGADSPTGVAAGPILVLAEVANLRFEAASGEVHLAWSPPRNALGVRVVRKRGKPPEGPGDGDKVEAAADGAHDHGLRDGLAYHYGVYALYQGPDGHARASRGVVVSAVPHAPAEGVDGLTLAPAPDGRLRVGWSPPAHGQVRILRTAEPPPWPLGARLATAAAEEVGGQWLEPSAADHAFDPHPPALGVCHYTPLTAWAGTLTAGRGAAYSCVADPSDLRAVRAGAGRVHLRWRWSPQGSESVVAWRSGTPPTGPDDPDARTVAVPEAEYGRQGFFALTLPAEPPGPWHVRVFGLATVGGRRVASPGLEPTARTVVPGPNPEVTVSYRLRRPAFPGRPWSVAFRTEPPAAAIPPTALVVHHRTVPLSFDDGEVVDRFPAARDGSTFRIRAGVPLAGLRARIFADPHAALDGLPPIRLRHPEADPARA